MQLIYLVPNIHLHLDVLELPIEFIQDNENLPGYTTSWTYLYNTRL
jgi:hypothetical protein